MTMTPIHYRQRDVCDDEGFPNADYGFWYQQGRNCYRARMNKALRKLAAQEAAKRFNRDGEKVEYWMLRAFIDGALRQVKGKLQPWMPEGFAWPTPPDAAWEIVACVYPNAVEIDMVHPVSRRFWSDDNELFELPDQAKFTRTFCERMGIPIIEMNPRFMPVRSYKKPRHLTLVHSAPSQPAPAAA